MYLYGMDCGYAYELRYLKLRRPSLVTILDPF